MEEIWKTIEGYEGLYEVSNLGRIKSLSRYYQSGHHFCLIKERILKPAKDKKGYLRIPLPKNRKKITHKIHRLVAKAFIPNPENKPQVNHKNSIPSDNRVDNLEWVTNAENQLHAYRNGLQPSKAGENNGRAKLTKEQVLEIRNRFKPGDGVNLAKEFNVYKTVIYKIVNREIWKNI